MTTMQVSRVDLDALSLSAREQVVLVELATDDTLEEIAARLWVSRNTVKTQVRAIYRKIGVATRADATRWVHAHL